MGRLIFDNFESVYLDTNVYIYFVEDNSHFGEQVNSILQCVTARELPVIASEIVFTELLALPLKKNNQMLVSVYVSLEKIIPSLQTIPLSREIAILAAQLRAAYNLRTPDAIHLATAIESGAECFITSDSKLKKVSEIRVEVIK